MTTFFLSSLIMLIICIMIMGLCSKHDARDEATIAACFTLIALICSGCSGMLLAIQFTIKIIVEAVK